MGEEPEEGARVLGLTLPVCDCCAVLLLLGVAAAVLLCDEGEAVAWAADVVLEEAAAAALAGGAGAGMSDAEAVEGAVLSWGAGEGAIAIAALMVLLCEDEVRPDEYGVGERVFWTLFPSLRDVVSRVDQARAGTNCGLG